MVEYREILEFYYKNNCYIMYLDNNNKHFFLKKGNDNKLYYLDVMELNDLLNCFFNTPYNLNAIKEKNTKKVKLIPKIIIGSIAVTLSLSIFGTIISVCQSKNRVEEFNENYSNEFTVEKVENYLSYNDENEKDDEFVVDTFFESKYSDTICIYDMNYLSKVLNNNVTIEMVKEAIDSNSFISTKMKNLLYDYCDSLIKVYPDVELRVFYNNLKSLKIIECDKKELFLKSLNIDSYGCYLRNENEIYVLNDCDYEKHTWAYQVIFHELSHCLRTGIWEQDGIKIKVQVEGLNFSNVITAEALNSLFAVSLFDYEEKDIAYQLQSNYHKIIIDCMDNYSLNDYIDHSISYYAYKLDEFNKDDNYATVILELIQMQYNDFHNDSISVNQEQYYPLYDYISSMYYKKYITEDMTYSEAITLTDELIEKIMYDVPEEYNIDTNHFYTYLQLYCSNLGINIDNKNR